MKLATGILILGMGLGTAAAQNPNIIDNTKAKLTAVQQQQTANVNAALGASPTQSATPQSASAKPAASKQASTAPAASQAQASKPQAASVTPAAAPNAASKTA